MLGRMHGCSIGGGAAHKQRDSGACMLLRGCAPRPPHICSYTTPSMCVCAPRPVCSYMTPSLRKRADALAAAQQEREDALNNILTVSTHACTHGNLLPFLLERFCRPGHASLRARRCTAMAHAPRTRAWQWWGGKGIIISITFVRAYY